MRRWDRIDWILSAITGVAIVLLAGSLGWPLVEKWQQRGRPGRQVARRFVGSATFGDMDYLLYLPGGYARKSTWPLLVFLHGAGERGDDLEIVKRLGPPRMVEESRSFPFIMVCPQCAAERGWESDEVLALIEHICIDWPVDRDRVYLMGYSMGAFGTWQTAMAAPERFAAIVPVAGGGDPAQAGRLAGVPVWAFHGDHDESVPLKSSEETAEAVKAAGGKAKLTVFKDAGHWILDRVCDDPAVWRWLLSQRRQAPKKASQGQIREAGLVDGDQT